MCSVDAEYWSLFDKATVDANGISDAMFILPNGKLKKLKTEKDGIYASPPSGSTKQKSFRYIRAMYPI